MEFVFFGAFFVFLAWLANYLLLFAVATRSIQLSNYRNTAVLVLVVAIMYLCACLASIVIGPKLLPSIRSIRDWGPAVGMVLPIWIDVLIARAKVSAEDYQPWPAVQVTLAILATLTGYVQFSYASKHSRFGNDEVYLLWFLQVCFLVSVSVLYKQGYRMLELRGEPRRAATFLYYMSCSLSGFWIILFLLIPSF